jgi:hypothetical protein
MRLATYTRHDDVGPDQIILRVAGDVDGVTVTLSDGRRDRLTLYSDPTHPGVGLAALVYPRNLDVHRIDLLDASGELLPDPLWSDLLGIRGRLFTRPPPRMST